MSTRILSLGLAISLLAAFARGQDTPKPTPAPTPGEAKEAQGEAPDASEGADAEKQAAAGDEQPEATDADGKVVGGKDKEEIKNLRPADVPGELQRVKSKADIKAEISIQTLSGRPVVFKGVIRNGKLIERLIDKRFVPQENLDHPHCGVRLWWAGESDGFIFFRYSVIDNVALTGTLTAEERREIFRKLKAKREGTATEAAAPVKTVEPELEKMSASELKTWLLQRYPYDKGWDHEKKRNLQRKEIVEKQTLTVEETVFVKYFSILLQARFEELKENRKKIQIEPGSDTESSESGTESGPGTPQPSGDKR